VSKKKNPNVIPVILAGGSGTRLWPLSSNDLPKQFLEILSEKTLLEQTINRFLAIAPKEVIVIGNSAHKELLDKKLPDTPSNFSIILEPLKKNTAPAITISALKANPEDYVLVTPSDHFLPRPDLLLNKIEELIKSESRGSIVLFGIKPTYPSESYGYIQKGKNLGNIFEVLSFKEKPNKKTAFTFLEKKEYLWNSGIFLFQAKDFINEMEKFNPLMLNSCRNALKKSTVEGDYIHLGKEDYEDLENISIDFALLEKTKSLKVAEIDTMWEDLGTWNSIKEHSLKDSSQNTLIGNVQVNDVYNSYISTDKNILIASGLKDLLVVDVNDQMLISHRDSLNEVENLNKNLYELDQLTHQTVRPWGTFKTLLKNDNCHVKLLIVNKGGQLSLQKHKHRSEHWTVTSGRAKVVKGEKEIELSKDNSIKIEKGEVHRISNIGDEELHIIEVQIGEYFGEDDIQRFDDIYDRK